MSQCGLRQWCVLLIERKFGVYKVREKNDWWLLRQNVHVQNSFLRQKFVSIKCEKERKVSSNEAELPPCVGCKEVFTHDGSSWSSHFLTVFYEINFLSVKTFIVNHWGFRNCCLKLSLICIFFQSSAAFSNVFDNSYHCSWWVKMPQTNESFQVTIPKGVERHV